MYKGNKYCIVKWGIALLTPFVIYALTCSCNWQNAEALHSLTDTSWQEYNQHLRDSAIKLLRTGDVVLRSGRGPQSYMLSQMNQRDKTYSHCGIVVVEGGYPYVYHSIGGEDNPDARLRKDPAAYFMNTRFNYGFGFARYTLSEKELQLMVLNIYRYYNQRPLFDMQFDLATDDYLYCSEFVYKVLCNTTGDTSWLPTSVTQGHRYVGIDDLYLNEHAKEVCRLVYK